MTRRKTRDDGWTLQGAKASFSRVVTQAQDGQAQLVTKHGRPAVYVVDARQFEALTGGPPARNLVGHLLNFPKGGPDDFDVERLPVVPRDIAL